MRKSRISAVLWTLQALLALFFALASGAPKLLLTQDMLGMWMPLPDAFVKFIGVAEVLGALGLILPALTRARPGLTLLAAGGLVFVTLSATVYQLAGGRVANALFALGLGGVVAIVAYGRWRLAPLQGQELLGDHAALPDQRKPRVGVRSAS